ncbi:J domain-containing protein [Komagataeibacter rhaeticus]|uniref:J domain-containing protein n=1 Tax=Komagataeibacter rhaeticus TaxID=215221 RepID=A0A181CDI9_9PROT|nr:J domain-containing protein [Komagataeibacter rhaeticus]ATU71667.1 J domain-containing protein [Komagataeibacter xylinus]EGG77353.1 Curved DNA-binding protein [Gluconacetobacter sp. SXCC-1]KDU96893.1 molecular chaperone DnaJ [Komagataeibacter rhaeticus AF1]MBL7240635.1 J domain-containing protein [Komagataeibacter rhaeticus]PYD53861.1 J domain-containing protein [Komagataeibacter rhaeticus]
MSKDPYEVLGLKRTASQDEIRKAYRKLAKKYHPDLNPGDKVAEENFKAVGAANALLSDEAQRARYDRGEIDASGQEKGFYGGGHGYRDHAEGPQGFNYGGGQFSEDDLGDIFGTMFGQGGGGAGFGGGFRRRPQGPQKGADRQYALTVSFLESVNGGTSRITLPGGAQLDVKIPPGIENDQVMRLRGKGDPGHQGGPAGDALITITVAPDETYTREGNDIRMSLPVDLKTAVLGGSITIPTPAGSVKMNVPPHSDSGSVLRLRGRGVKAHGKHEAGNLYVRLVVTIGTVDPALEAFLKDWTPGATTEQGGKKA